MVQRKHLWVQSRCVFRKEKQVLTTLQEPLPWVASLEVSLAVFCLLPSYSVLLGTLIPDA